MLAAALLGVVAPGHGQQFQRRQVGGLMINGPAGPAQLTDAVTLPRNPESKRLIQAAQDYIKKKEWRIAAECLQSLLETPEDSFLDVSRANESGAEAEVKVSVRTEANRLIGGLPPEGLESYQVQYGQAAEARLREAVEAADPVLLAEVSQRFLHTKAGLQATDLLGTYHLDRGQYLMASLCYERLLGRSDSGQLPPPVLFKAALAYRRAGQATGAAKIVGRLQDQLRRGDLTLGKVRLNTDQVRAELEREIADQSAAGPVDWPVFRGNPSRSAQAAGSTAYLEPRWTASLYRRDEPGDPKDRPAVTWIDQHLDTAVKLLGDKPVLPAFFPVAAGGQLLVRRYDGVAAYALRPGQYGSHSATSAGQFLWSCKADLSLFHTVSEDLEGRRRTAEQWYNDHYLRGNVGPPGVFFENSVLGSLSHDAQRVYFIDDLAVPPLANMLAGGFNGFVPNPMPLTPFTEQVRYNRLIAADLDTGKLSWTPLGGKSPTALPGAVEPTKDVVKPRTAGDELQDSFFLGPPLPLGGKIYLLVEKNAELRLVCLEPKDRDRPPELVWVQSLGTANNPLPGDSLRRLQACHLAYGEGILVCPTNAGAVLGVDLLSHSLVWAYPYRKPAPPPSTEEPVPARPMLRGQRYASPNPGERWRPSAPCVAAGKVVFTAHDGGDVDVHCVNLRDGRRVWTAKRDGNNDLYLAGVFDDRVLVVAKNHVRALNLADGREAWPKRAETGLPSGQGVAAEGVYYLPLANSADPKSADRGPEICAIDIRSGQVVGHSKSRKGTPGNLIFAGGEMISQTVKTVAAFPLLKAKQAEITGYLARNPNDPTGLTERGELHLYNGEVRPAVADLRAALANGPQDGVRTKARSKLHEALTQFVQTDFAGAEPFLAEYEELCHVEMPAGAGAELRQKLSAEQTRRRASYLELVGKGREGQGRVIDAFAAYEQFASLADNKELVDLIEEPNTRARPDIWSRGRIQAMLASASADGRRQLEAEIAKRWERVRDGGNLDGLRSFVGLYGSLSAAGKAARLELAGRLMASGEPEDLTEAERVLAVLCYSAAQRREDPPAAARALELMSRVCVRRGQYENAVGFYRQLGEEFPDVPVRDGQTGKQLFEELITDKRFVPYLDSPAVIWSGALSGRRQPGSFQPPAAVALSLEPVGELLPFFERNRVVVDSRPDGQNACTLRVLDRASGEERWKVPNLPGVAHVQNASGTIPAPPAFARGQTLVVSLGHWVITFDLADRRELWRYDLLGKDPLPLAGPNSLTTDPNQGLVLATADGRKTVVGRVAVAEATYVALQSRDGLVALDPARPGPSVQWCRTDVTPRAQVFGDDRHVFVYDKDAPAGSHCRALRAQDGASVTVPDFTELMTKKPRMLGGRLLVKESGDALRLHDVMSGREVWRRDFVAGAVVAATADPCQIAVVEPRGHLTLLDARTGEPRLNAPLAPELTKGLTGATLLADRDRYYLALTKKHQGGGRLEWSCAAGFGVASALVNDSVCALSRRTGAVEWVSDFLPHQALLLERWADLPVLLFAAKYERTGANNHPEKQAVRVAAVDKTSGKLVYDEDLVINTQFHELKANPAAGRIELVRNDLKIVLQPTDAAANPEPPAPALSRPPRFPFPGVPVVPRPKAVPGGV